MVGSIYSKKVSALNNNNLERINIEESGEVMKLFFKYVLNKCNSYKLTWGECCLIHTPQNNLKLGHTYDEVVNISNLAESQFYLSKIRNSYAWYQWVLVKISVSKPLSKLLFPLADPVFLRRQVSIFEKRQKRQKS